MMSKVGFGEVLEMAQVVDCSVTTSSWQTIPKEFDFMEAEEAC